ncbi:MAG TPA: pyridoxal phosphate-dependent aminotransferase [Ktedonobacteraceae bacterium]|nr:pyridoxal phosphate-dependent aminotransferase [Ktedonobacteraceae bacterium]
MITHDQPPVNSPNSFDLSSPSLQEQHMIIRQLRQQAVSHYRPLVREGSSPIRVMARMVQELEQRCRELHLAEEVIRSEIVNRTIGDVNLRNITEYEGEPGGPRDYRLLADELGVALPGEPLHGYLSSGETYLWLREQMQVCERELLQRGIDLRIYDIYGNGNIVLRGWLAGEMRKWGIAATAEQLYLGLGAMDIIDKVLRGLAVLFKDQRHSDIAVLFPAPGFNVPEWQAQSYGYRLHKFHTDAANYFKLTAQQLDDILAQAPDIRAFYLTVTNNPTTFAYTPDELNQIFAVLRKYWESGREIYILADLAYIGTGIQEEDQARMATFNVPDVYAHTFFISSFSKSYTLTGERFGWVTIGSPQAASKVIVCWANSMASLPAEWQLRYMAYTRLIQARPWLLEKLRAFYRLRRNRLIAQLQRLDEEFQIFNQIHVGDDATVYNWSQLRPGEDAFSAFEKTGIAGVPGSGFGYTDDYVRFSIGVIPVPVIDQ